MKQYLEIVDVLGREVIDSRGNPTVEVGVAVDDGNRIYMGRAAVPPAPPPVSLKRLSSATVTRTAILARAS